MAAPGCKIYVGNLPSGIAERDLEDEFIRFGTLRSVWVARKPPGFGEHLRHHHPLLLRPATSMIQSSWQADVSRSPKCPQVPPAARRAAASDAAAAGGAQL